MMFGNRAKNAPTSFLPEVASEGGLMPTQSPAPDPRPNGFFGEGGVGRNIAGYLGDYLAQLGGARPIFAPVMQQRQALHQQQTKRQNDWEDWVRQAQWERANPKPVNNDTVADYEFIRSKLGDTAGQEYLRNKANPPQYRQGPDGQFYRIDTGAAESSAPPTAPVGKLTPIQATTQNTPAPQLGGSGFPASLTPDQYQAVVNAKGKSATDAWVARHGIKIGN